MAKAVARHRMRICAKALQRPCADYTSRQLAVTMAVSRLRRMAWSLPLWRRVLGSRTLGRHAWWHAVHQRVSWQAHGAVGGTRRAPPRWHAGHAATRRHPQPEDRAVRDGDGVSHPCYGKWPASQRTSKSPSRSAGVGHTSPVRISSTTFLRPLGLPMKTAPTRRLSLKKNLR